MAAKLGSLRLPICQWKELEQGGTKWELGNEQGEKNKQLMSHRLIKETQSRVK